MWERFSFYGMRAILVLYIAASAQKGGLGWAETDALTLYGWYTMMVYVMSIPGGIIADRYLGQRKSVMIGGFLLCAGHFLMAYIAMWAFYSALALIVMGVGMLKPNISTMVGGLYHKNDLRTDSGFTIFYMGINIGAFAASIIVGYVGEVIGWHYGFALAGIGMILGQAVYISGQKYLGDAGLFIPPERNPARQTIKKPLSSVEKDRIVLLLLSFLIVIVFWAAFEQAGGLMNLYTQNKIDRVLFGWEISSAAFMAAHLPTDIATSNTALAASLQHFLHFEYISQWLASVAPAYIPLTSAESIVVGFQIPTSWFQALNPLFIILFAPVLAWLWIYLGRRKQDPSAIFKMGLGTVILGTGFLLMMGAVIQSGGSYSGKAHMFWLFGAYFLHTMGELCLSPVSLSFITKMAPERLVASLMGLYFAATGIASKGAAVVGKLASSLGEYAVFGGIAATTIILGLLLMAFTKKLNKLSHHDEK
jgi:POT family proton-dependent oligopeptide transporter